MKRLYLLLAVLMPLSALAQQIDTSAVDPNKYAPELGFFQKAHRDVTDPRFMLTDQDKKFSLGVGGTVHINTFYDFNGALGNFLFSPSGISVPTDKTGNFGFTATGSDVYVKAKANPGKKVKLIALLDLSGYEAGDSDYILLNQAYVSVNGLTVGKTYSFFMDLEAGPLTVDLQGPNTQIYALHNLIGYTQPIGKHWTLAAALERPNSISMLFQEYQISTNYNKLPDFTAHVKYRGDKGHLQAGLLLKQISYWASKDGFDSVTGVSKYAPGFGVSLSGNYNPNDRLFLSFQATYGKAATDYIQDLSGLYVNLGLKDLDKDGYVNLAPVTNYGGYASISYYWTESLRSAAVYGLCCLDNNGLTVADTFKRSDYFATNLFYFFSPYCFIGAEYLHGRKVVYAPQGTDDRGQANRLDLCVCYRF